MAFTLITQGTVTQGSTAQNLTIPLPSSADYFVSTNLTQMALSPNPGVCVRGEWYGGGLTASGDGLSWTKTNSGNAINIDSFVVNSAVGYTYVKGPILPGPAVTGTAITNANPAVVTMTNTFSEGQTVYLYGTTGMLQIAGAAFTISNVSGSGFTLAGLNASAFATAATAVIARGIPTPYSAVEPRFLYVTNVSQATQAVVTVSEKHNYVVGQKVEFQIPGSFGMVQLNNFNLAQNNAPTIVAVTDYTMTINVNSTAFTAFAWPASSASPTAQLFATLSPAGQSVTYNPITGLQTGYNVQYAPFHTGNFVPFMMLPAGAQNPGGQANDVIVWQAYKMETGTINSPNPS